MHFFPYDPRRARWALVGCAVVCVVLGAWTLASARQTADVGAWARLGLLMGLLGAFGYVLFRIRPRPGWGVKVEPLGFTFQRPLSGDEVHLVWSQIAEVRRDGRRREKLLILVRPEGRVLLQRHLFASAEVFEALTRALEAKMPPARYDA